MRHLLQTMGAAFILILIALLLLGLSLLLTGKLKIKRGACGRDPTKKQDESCGSSTHCVVCDHNPENDKKKHERLYQDKP